MGDTLALFAREGACRGRECHVMDERVRFIGRLLDGEKMARLCAEFGISRKTGYKLFHRYKGCGIDGLTDRSRRPQRFPRCLGSSSSGCSRVQPLERSQPTRSPHPWRQPTADATLFVACYHDDHAPNTAQKLSAFADGHGQP